ncbi:acetyl-CoA carboxylase biotin carboxyl carrier protein [Shuttleworthella satelles]|uniref:Biotin carboxyl carrier protein of acetyl-CoA carboxylase n=1 Tax=Shuttleworthella satelles DSM 14600 TaxID=626523 RepID=C4G8L4_9FIRM|nr:acetyl-CoA carboxylase biotin carboxyl carrier protein [Shuttleworthia satelles]EEP28961.1 acetyl-CoA carboxylase, biotin carboxyl carrier protein [Shuttleworthia satelles DSM 14600]
MNEKEIRKYAGLMKELDLTGLEITNDETKVRLERGSELVSVLPSAGTAGDPAACDTGKMQKKEGADAAASEGKTITSPLVGIFYAAAEENGKPFVAVGDHVKKGQTLCIVEAMKLLNEVTAEEDGVIKQICASNGQLVEYGTALFVME